MRLGLSHPVWVCGLKQLDLRKPGEWKTSHPVWVCGLKPKDTHRGTHREQVTPCMGVWIETPMEVLVEKVINVTPCMGVWIETHILQTL